MNRIRSRWWLFRIHREYDKSKKALTRYEPGSLLQLHMARRLEAIMAVIADAENEYYSTGAIKGIRA